MKFLKTTTRLTFKKFIFMISFPLLSACGGGGENGEDGGSKPDNNPEPTQFNTNVYVSTFDSCGEVAPFQGAQVVFYKQDNKTIDETITVDSLGAASFKQENDKISFSVITNENVENTEEKSFQITSFVGVKSNSNYQINDYSDTQGSCQCTESTITVDFPHYEELSYAYIETSERNIHAYNPDQGDGSPYINGSTAYFPNIKICFDSMDVVSIHGESFVGNNYTYTDDIHLDVPVDTAIYLVANDTTTTGIIDINQIFDIERIGYLEPGDTYIYHGLVKNNVSYYLNDYGAGFPRFDNFPSDGHYYAYHKYIDYDKGLRLTHIKVVPEDYNSPLAPSFADISEFDVMFSDNRFTWQDPNLLGFSRVTATLWAGLYNDISGNYEQIVNWSVYSETEAEQITLLDLPESLSWVKDNIYPEDMALRVGKYEDIDSFQQQMAFIYPDLSIPEFKSSLLVSDKQIVSASALSFFRLIDGRSQWFIIDNNINQ